MKLRRVIKRESQKDYWVSLDHHLLEEKEMGDQDQVPEQMLFRERVVSLPLLAPVREKGLIHAQRCPVSLGVQQES